MIEYIEVADGQLGKQLRSVVQLDGRDRCERGGEVASQTLQSCKLYHREVTELYNERTAGLDLAASLCLLADLNESL
jgi:hypothetical protein